MSNAVNLSTSSNLPRAGLFCARAGMTGVATVEGESLCRPRGPGPQVAGVLLIHADRAPSYHQATMG